MNNLNHAELNSILNGLYTIREKLITDTAKEANMQLIKKIYNILIDLED